MVNRTYEEVDTDTKAGEDFFSTPALETPPSVPEAHRAMITGVVPGAINDSWSKITVGLVSRDVPTIDQKFEILLPKAYTDSIGSGKAFDPKTLPANAQTSYRLGVANSDYTATLQVLVSNIAGTYPKSDGKTITVQDSIARAAGRDARELGLSRPTNYESYVEGLEKMLSGLEVIMLLREKGGDDPAFAHRLIAKEIVSADEYDRNPKRFKKYQLAWENS
jgi:hypothetical protein